MYFEFQSKLKKMKKFVNLLLGLLMLFSISNLFAESKNHYVSNTDRVEHITKQYVAKNPKIDFFFRQNKK